MGGMSQALLVEQKDDVLGIYKNFHLKSKGESLFRTRSYSSPLSGQYRELNKYLAYNRVSQPSILFDDMNDLFKGFAKAHAEQNGYLLAATLSPIATSVNPQRLRLISKSSNSSSVKGDIKHFIKSNTSHQRSLDHEEVKGWVEVYAAYWNAIGDFVAVEDGKVV